MTVAHWVTLRSSSTLRVSDPVWIMDLKLTAYQQWVFQPLKEMLIWLPGSRCRATTDGFTVETNSFQRGQSHDLRGWKEQTGAAMAWDFSFGWKKKALNLSASNIKLQICWLFGWIVNIRHLSVWISPPILPRRGKCQTINNQTDDPISESISWQV